MLPIYDALFKQTRSSTSWSATNRRATHAAEGYARSTGKPGVVLVTSGPGATNAVTGITDALMDSIPMVVITGQVATHLIGTDAFQEADTVGITRHCTKHNYLVKTRRGWADIIHEAFHIATSGRPGPGRDRYPQGCSGRHRALHKPGKIEHKSYQPAGEGRHQLIEAAVEMLAAPNGRSSTPAAASSIPARVPAVLRELAADHRRAGYLDPDGARCLSGDRRCSGWGCWGCTAPMKPIWR